MANMLDKILNKEKAQEQSMMSEQQRKQLEQANLEKELALKDAQIAEFQSRTELNTAKKDETLKKGFKAEKEALAKDMDTKEKRYNLEKLDAEDEEKQIEKEAGDIQTLKQKERELMMYGTPSADVKNTKDKKQEELRNNLYLDPSSVAPNTPEGTQALMAQKQALGQPQAQPMEEPAPQMAPAPQPVNFDTQRPSVIPTEQPKFQSLPEVNPADYENKALDRYNEQAEVARIKLNANIAKQKNLKDVFLKTRDESTEKLNNINAQLKDLRDNSPSYNNAIRNIPTSAKILSVIGAGLLALSGDDNPLATINMLIKRAYDDELLKYNSKIEGLKDEKSLLAEIMQINKDDYNTELLYQNEVLKNVEKNLSISQGLVTNEQSKIQNKKLMQNLKNQVLQNENQIKQNAFANQWSVNQATLAQRNKTVDDNVKFKLREMDRQKALDIQRLKNTGKSAKDYSLGGIEFKNKEAYKKGLDFVGKNGQNLRNLADAQQALMAKSAKSLSGKAKKIKQAYDRLKGDSVAKKWGKSAWGKLKELSGFENKYRQDLITTSDYILKLVLETRIESTGGGNMTEKEAKFIFARAGVDIDYDNMSLDSLHKAIHTSIVNGTYSQVVKNANKLAQDRARDIYRAGTGDVSNKGFFKFMNSAFGG